MLFSPLSDSRVWSGQRAYDGLGNSNVWSGQRAYDGLSVPPSIVHPGTRRRGYAGLGQEEKTGTTGDDITSVALKAAIAGVIGGLIFAASTYILPVKTTTK